MAGRLRKLAEYLLVLAASAAPMWAQGEFWGELKAGKYGVGFRAVYQADSAR